MSVSEAQRKANKKYFDKAWSQVKLSMPNDEADALRQYCSAHGLTVAGFIRGLIRDAIAADPVQASPAAAAGQGVPGGGYSRRQFFRGPSSTRLEARFPYHGSGAMTRSPSPLAWRPDFPGAPREAH